MNVLVVEPGYLPYEKEINGLEEEQAVVGGLITISYPFEEQVGIVSNDDSLYYGLPFNRSIPGGYGGIFGTFFVCGIIEDRFCSLTPEQVKKYKEYFQYAELLIGADGNEPVTLKFLAKEKHPEKDSHERKHDSPER